MVSLNRSQGFGAANRLEDLLNKSCAVYLMTFHILIKPKPSKFLMRVCVSWNMYNVYTIVLVCMGEALHISRRYETRAIFVGNWVCIKRTILCRRPLFNRMQIASIWINNFHREVTSRLGSYIGFPLFLFQAEAFQGKTHIFVQILKKTRLLWT